MTSKGSWRLSQTWQYNRCVRHHDCCSPWSAKGCLQKYFTSSPYNLLDCNVRLLILCYILQAMSQIGWCGDKVTNAIVNEHVEVKPSAASLRQNKINCRVGKSATKIRALSSHGLGSDAVHEDHVTSLQNDEARLASAQTAPANLLDNNGYEGALSFAPSYFDNLIITPSFVLYAHTRDLQRSLVSLDSFLFGWQIKWQISLAIHSGIHYTPLNLVSGFRLETVPHHIRWLECCSAFLMHVQKACRCHLISWPGYCFLIRHANAICLTRSQCLSWDLKKMLWSCSRTTSNSPTQAIFHLDYLCLTYALEWMSDESTPKHVKAQWSNHVHPTHCRYPNTSLHSHLYPYQSLKVAKRS